MILQPADLVTLPAPLRMSGLVAGRRQPLPAVRGAARFSRDGAYRFSLERVWGEGPRVAWVMLNPSRATAEADDATLRRCAGFARGWGCGALEVVNLFAAVATVPSALRAHPAPVGRGNDEAITAAVARADLVVAAWGTGHRGQLDRAAAVLRVLPEATCCLGVTVSGDPRHPLRVARDTPLQLLAR